MARQNLRRYPPEVRALIRFYERRIARMERHALKLIKKISKAMQVLAGKTD